MIVNAAGAWAARVGGSSSSTSRSRSGATTRATWACRELARPIPVVIDNANSMYFRPEGADMVLIGLEDDNQIGGSPDRDTGEAAPTSGIAPRSGSSAASRA